MALYGYLDQFLQALYPKRLLQRWMIPKFIQQDRWFVTGRENERQVARLDRFGDGEDRLFVEIDIHDCDIEMGLLYELDCLTNAARLSGRQVHQWLCDGTVLFNCNVYGVDAGL